jgi:ribosome maturation factor RimP
MAKLKKYQNKKERSEQFGARGKAKLCRVSNDDLIVAQTEALAEALLESEGMELVHAEYVRGPGGRALRCYIDKREGVTPKGITIADCAYISRQLGDLLDVKLQVNEPYNLEISSPGLNRPLKKMSDFERFKGQKAFIRTIEAIDGQRNFKGILAEVSEDTVYLKEDVRTIAISHEAILKARD